MNAEQIWQLADKDGDGYLDQYELQRIMHKLNLFVPSKTVEALYAEFVSDKRNGLNYTEFQRLYGRLSQREDLRLLYDLLVAMAGEAGSINGGCSKILSLDKFKEFLLSTQQETDINDILRAVQQTGDNVPLESFIAYMESSAASVFDQQALQSHGPLDRPLTEYFIDSSHNSYLTGDQLRSESSTEAYKQILLSGCRCVELDCWDGTDGEPIVYHGHTLTSKITFRSVIETIREYAFKASPYPVILSLELHCHEEQQVTMANILRGILGDCLLTAALLPHNVAPTPEALKYKVMVKCKASKSPSAATADGAAGEEKDMLEDLKLEDITENDEYYDGESDESDELSIQWGSPKKTVSGASTAPGSPQPPRQDQSKKTPWKIVNRFLKILGMRKASDQQLHPGSDTAAAESDFERKDRQKIDKTIADNKLFTREDSSKMPASPPRPASAATSIQKPKKLRRLPTGRIPGRRASFSATTSDISATSAHNRKTTGGSRTKGGGKSHHIAPELGSLAVYMQAVKFKSFNSSTEATHNFRTISSLSERRAAALIENSRGELIRFNGRTFTRIYPKGSRIDSSNFDPTQFWGAGCQVVALNYQTFDRGMQLNKALFSQNQRCGYVLKPAYLRPPYPQTTPAATKKHPIALQVVVLSAAVLPKPNGVSKGEIIDPYVQVTLFTPQRWLQQQELEEFQTDVVNDNGFNPRWHSLDKWPHINAKKFSTNITQPELSFLRFVIKDKDVDRDDFIAAGCVPINAMKSGYRHVPLYDWTGELLTTSRLLVYVYK